MGIFDDVITNAKSAADKVGKKAEQLVDYSKIRYAISELRSDIKVKYGEFGRFMYFAEIEGKMDNEEYTQRITELKDLNDQLASTEHLLMEAKNKKRCPVCGEVSNIDYLYCHNCGAKLPEAEKPPQGEPQNPAKPDAAETVDDDNADVVIEVEEE